MNRILAIFFMALTFFVNINLIAPNRINAATKIFGVLQPSLTNITTNKTAGINTVVVSLSWKKFEPTENTLDTVYINGIKDQINQYKAAGMSIILSTGVHHTPAWIFNYPNSRFVNQYGEEYTSIESGKGVGNMVFNQTLRTKQSEYLQSVFAQLGTDFYAVRAGGGWYGELNYPSHTYNSKTNVYWGFDAISKGTSIGLPAGVTTNPVPNWLPGEVSVNHDSARLFVNWYMNSMKNYHDWQISTIRSFYPGNITMMYPSWGVRPGDLDKAIAVDLNGTTSAETNGEIQRGFDFARYISGIKDSKVIVYTTWLNANLGDDSSTNQARWNPVHFIYYYAKQNPLQLKVMGENTGKDTLLDMDFTFAQMDKYGLEGIVWAFEPELYDTTGQFATISNFATHIAPYNLPVSDTNAPSVTITVPTNGSSIKYGRNTTISATVSDDVAISSVKFQVNGTTICSLGNQSTYNCVWSVPSTRRATYSITVIATDSSGNVTSKQVKVSTN